MVCELIINSNSVSVKFLKHLNPLSHEVNLSNGHLTVVSRLQYATVRSPCNWGPFAISHCPLTLQLRAFCNKTLSAHLAIEGLLQYTTVRSPCNWGPSAISHWPLTLQLRALCNTTLSAHYALEGHLQYNTVRSPCNWGPSAICHCPLTLQLRAFCNKPLPAHLAIEGLLQYATVRSPCNWGPFYNTPLSAHLTVQSKHVARLFGLGTDSFYPPPQEITVVLISLRRWVDPRVIVRSAGLGEWKIPMTRSGIEFAQYLN
jgi:hypothetical protein